MLYDSFYVKEVCIVWGFNDKSKKKMRIKAVVCGLFLLLGWGCAQSIAAQNPPVVNNKGVGRAAQPKIIVVPFTRQGQNVRRIIENNPMYVTGLSKLKEAFNLRGFPTRDFVTLLKATKVNEMISEAKNTQSDLIKSIVRNSKADISVSVRMDVTRLAEGKTEVNVILEADETATGASLANASFNSDIFITQDTVKLANKALKKISDNFFYQLQSGFANMLENGRELKIILELGESAEMTAYTQVGNDGDDLESALHTWMMDHAYKGTYDISSGENLIEISMQVPVYESNGRPFSIGRMRSVLLRYLRKMVSPLSHNVTTVRSAGQVINLMIE